MIQSLKWPAAILSIGMKPTKSAYVLFLGLFGFGSNWVLAEPVPTFSSLTAERQAELRKSVAPPPLSQRRNPYSTPMYYQMWGTGSPDGKSHPEWQEALIRDWAELGMSQLHFYAYPEANGTSNRSYTLSETSRQGIRSFMSLCEKYGIRLGLRVDLPCTVETSKGHPVANYWIAHPNNPENELEPYFGWLTELLTLMKGHLLYAILGDELEWKAGNDPQAWNADSYMKFFTRAAAVVHKADPEIRVSMYSASPSRWREVVGLLESGYAKHGDAVAINHYDYKVLRRFKADLEKYSPDKKLLFLSNGVGYIACDTTERNPPKDGYKRYNDQDQAAMIARTMYSGWDLDMDAAPYYICLRNIVYNGKKTPQWYGFFGFMDLIIDEQGQASITHYPGWYAYQTVAQVFHDRASFSEPAFAVECDPAPEYLKAYQRKGSELLVICWGKEKTSLRIATTDYAYPVQIDLLDYRKWRDIPATQTASGVRIDDVPLGLSPTIIRLFPKR